MKYASDAHPCGWGSCFAREFKFPVVVVGGHNSRGEKGGVVYGALRSDEDGDGSSSLRVVPRVDMRTEHHRQVATSVTKTCRRFSEHLRRNIRSRDFFFFFRSQGRAFLDSIR